jgi:hypothetical protein
MILERYRWNNGYGCSCCQNDYSEYNWIDNSKIMSFETICAGAAFVTLDGTIDLTYENDGNLLYGYVSETYRGGIDVYVVFGGSVDKSMHKYCIKSDTASIKTTNKEEIIRLYNEHITEVV